MRGQKTSPELIEQAKALYLVKDSISAVARALNMPPKTVEGIIKRDDAFAEVRLQQKKEMILIANQKAREFLFELDPSKAKSEMEKSTVFGTLIDKNAVLAGEQFKSGAMNFNLDNRQITFKVSPSLAQVIDQRQKDSLVSISPQFKKE